MGTGLEAALPKILGGGLGAAGGALAQDPSQLSSFVDATGNSGINGGAFTSVDPADLLAQGLGRSNLLFNTFANLANQPTQLGPASIIQTAPFAFGGALPAPIGISIRDPGFLQRPGLDIFNAQGPPLISGPGDGLRPPTFSGDPNDPGTFVDPRDDRDPRVPPTINPEDPRVPPPPESPGVPIEPRRRFEPPEERPGSFEPFSLPTALPTQRNELSQFLDAINIANMSRARPVVQGGLV